MLRKILATLAGLATGVAVMIPIQLISLTVHPMPKIAEGDREALRQHMENAPVSAMLIVLASYAVATFCAGWAAGRIGRSWIPVVLVGIFFELAGVANITSLPGHPLWFTITSLSIFIPAAFLGGWLAMPKAKASGGR